MTNEARKVTLWTSINSERTGLEGVEQPESLNSELVEKIRQAFVKKSSDERIKKYCSSSIDDEVSLARIFG